MDDVFVKKIDWNRWGIPNTLREISSPYDQDSALFQDLRQRGIMPVKTYRFSVAAAGSRLIDESGYHFVLYGDDGSPATPVPAINTSLQVDVYINQQSSAQGHPFPAKHARGFSGPFSQLFLSWVAQSVMASTPYMTLVIFKSIEKPWIDGESAT